MTDHDIRDFIEECEEPIFLKDIMSKLTSKDPTISWKRVTKLMREMGFENKVCKNALNDKGKGSVWTRVNDVATCGDDDYDDGVDVTDETDETCETEEQEEQEEQDAPTVRSTEEVVSEVEERNAANIAMNAKLLETLNVSRGLRAEMIARQQEVLIEMARRILGLYGSEKERKTYGDF